ncbi:MFS transporter small subunit [Kineococcus arenarius]|uniref:MFS transporter small subunit n=1 Tax=unclassified Kineococcus TaxID=2621656 RepID=UPI003D7E773F
MSASTGSTGGGATTGGRAGGGSGARVALAWTLVGVPLAYGLVETLVRASRLFTG